MNAEHQASTKSEINRLMMRWAVVLVALGCFALWATWRLSTAARRGPERGGSAAASAPLKPQIEHWTCSMHPQVRQPQPGDCPICGMKLLPQYAGSSTPGVPPEAGDRQVAEPAPQAWYRCTMPECNDPGSADSASRCPVCGMRREQVTQEAAGADLGEYALELSDRARRLAGVASEPVGRRHLSKLIRTVGKITYDETRHKMVSAWTGGRIDKLFADFTGMVVSKGDHLVAIYSPDLLSAQEEYLQALRSAASMRRGGSDMSRSSAEQLAVSARRKLELLGVTGDQIAAIEQAQAPATQLVVYAPLGGTIVRKAAMEGMYVKTGDVLYEIADLTQVWLMLDLYEVDLPWVKPFQDVQVTAESLPGEEFPGEIVFIDPVVDALTRTIKVRCNVANPDRKLKPDMFVSAEIAVAMDQQARATTPHPQGSHACPMHTWEVADERADCPICQMKMVAVDSIPGYAAPGTPGTVLSVPREAVLRTGERAVTYVETAAGQYLVVEITIGPRAHDQSGREYYPVLRGLTEGQRVVTKGNFVIDSQMQITGKRSLFDTSASPPLPIQRPGPQDDSHTTPASGSAAARPLQTTCPVMGGAIDPQVFIEYKGVKVYFCCPGCDRKFRDHPQKYIPKLPEAIRRKIARAQPPQGGQDGG